MEPTSSRIFKRKINVKERRLIYLRDIEEYGNESNEEILVLLEWGGGWIKIGADDDSPVLAVVVGRSDSCFEKQTLEICPRFCAIYVNKEKEM